ncbi:MAG: peroxidase [Planctomycetota bacterium]|nr:MAG: peroxidase [Planctomycetota bacterium]
MLGYVEQLTLRPGSVTRADVDALVQVGFTDADVLAVCEVTAYYAYVNRIADGLGVEIEADNSD